MHLKAGMCHYITFLENYLLLEMFEEDDTKGVIRRYQKGNQKTPMG
jgi:hypothetical protein